MGVLIGEGGGDVGEVVGERGCELLLRGDDHLRVRLEQVEQRAEALDGQQIGDVRSSAAAIAAVVPAGEFGEHDRIEAMLGGELGGRRDLHLVNVAEGALGEGGEPAQGFDLQIEHVDAHGAVLRRGIHVQQAAAHRELTPLLHLLSAFVAGGDELFSALIEIQQLADAQGEGVRAKDRVGHLLGEGDGADDDDRAPLRVWIGRPRGGGPRRAGGGVRRVPIGGVRRRAVGAVEQGIEGGDAQADEVGGGLQV